MAATEAEYVAEITRLRVALLKIVRIASKAQDAPNAADRWLDRIEDAAIDALGAPAKETET